jgi:hypothetical protein
MDGKLQTACDTVLSDNWEGVQGPFPSKQQQQQQQQQLMIFTNNSI